MKILSYLMSAFMIFCALGVTIYMSGSDRWLVALSCWSTGVYFFFQARSWTPEKALRIFGLKPKKIAPKEKK